MTVRLVSLDVWNTLLVSNPDYAAARRRFLAAELPAPAERIEQVYGALKAEADRSAEEDGAALTNHDTYCRFMDRLGLPADYDWWPIRRGLELLFFRHPPIYRPGVVSELRRLQVKGYRLSIASNTNFIRGEALHDSALGGWGVDWDFQVFSDALGHAKPAARFWNEVAFRAALLGVQPDQIVHIGDHLVCDGGCRAHGIQFEHVANPAEVETILGRLP